MKNILLLSCVALLFTGAATQGAPYIYSLRAPSAELTAKVNNVVFEEDAATGAVTKLADLGDAGIYRVAGFQVNKTAGKVFVVENVGAGYKVKVVGLSPVQVIASLELEVQEPDVRLLSNPHDGSLFVTYWDEKSQQWRTNFYAAPGYAAAVPFENCFLDGNLYYFSEDGKALYAMCNKSGSAEGFLDVVNPTTGAITASRPREQAGLHGDEGVVFGGLHNDVFMVTLKDGVYSYYLYNPVSNAAASGIIQRSTPIRDFALTPGKKLIVQEADEATKKPSATLTVYDLTTGVEEGAVTTPAVGTLVSGTQLSETVVVRGAKENYAIDAANPTRAVSTIKHGEDVKTNP